MFDLSPQLGSLFDEFFPLVGAVELSLPGVPGDLVDTQYVQRSREHEADVKESSWADGHIPDVVSRQQ